MLENKNKVKFVCDYIQGYIDGHKERLDLMGAEEMEHELTKIEGAAEAIYEQIEYAKKRNADCSKAQDRASI